MKIQIYNSEIEFIIVPNKTFCVIKNLPADFCNPLNKGHMEKEMANHSSILAWRIPWTEEPGGLQSTGLQ